MLLFAYLLFEYPRPTKRAWLLPMRYMVALIVAKLLFQLPIFCQTLDPITQTWQYVGVLVFSCCWRGPALTLCDSPRANQLWRGAVLQHGFVAIMGVQGGCR